MRTVATTNRDEFITGRTTTAPATPTPDYLVLLFFDSCFFVFNF
jgi:hypothetical protein